MTVDRLIELAEEYRLIYGGLDEVYVTDGKGKRIMDEWRPTWIAATEIVRARLDSGASAMVCKVR